MAFVPLLGPLLAPLGTALGIGGAAAGVGAAGAAAAGTAGLGTALAGGLATMAASKLLMGKPPTPAPGPGAATRDDAEALASRQNDLARRKGSAADIVTGAGGAEAAAPGARFVLGN